MKVKLIVAVTIVMSLVFGGVTFAADPTPTPQPAETQEEEAQKIDINSATLEELMELPGVGEVIAQRIIDARPYAKPEELIEKVKGIGEKTYAKMKDLIVANPVEEDEGQKDESKKEDKPAPTPTPKK